ncbi:hypothetical protein PI172_1472 [Prevotella intermedia]|uniref:Uncharacterized protein n=1 Tax=Prevotella intermedia TaxID=28131 RepID=A0AAD1F7H0_PREIN|nr:hypothetical protein PIN17_A1207 [Prevotella intermedia 17]BAR96200.1 hypothetical protein PI172_1472 [Prevotella intermedia]
MPKQTFGTLSFCFQYVGSMHVLQLFSPCQCQDSVLFLLHIGKLFTRK